MNINIITNDKVLDVLGLPDTMTYTVEKRPDNHQGWTNYETWRVNLEIFDGTDWNEYYGEDSDKYAFYDFVEQLKEMADDHVTNFGQQDGLAVDYARSFLQEVNYNEIAESILESYPNLKEKITV